MGPDFVHGTFGVYQDYSFILKALCMEVLSLIGSFLGHKSLCKDSFMAAALNIQSTSTIETVLFEAF